MAGNTNNTIRGKYPAVCFTEQPLAALVDSCDALPSRYSMYGVILHKWPLYAYGGRPALYGDENLLGTLDDEHQYLWNRYNPIPAAVFNNSPVDWTHEREWRSRIRQTSHGLVGTTPADGVPLLLPPVKYPASEKEVLALPRFFVRTAEEQIELREFVKAIPTYNGGNQVIMKYFQHLGSVRIIPLELVRSHLQDGRLEFGSLETLPYNEIDPGIDIPTPESYL